ILASVMGTFVLGIGNGIDQNAPAATFEYELNDGGDGWSNGNDWINITHTGGDMIDPDTVRGTVGGKDIEGLGANWSSRIEAGDTVSITEGSTTDHATVSAIEEGDTFRLIWSREDVDETIIIATKEIT
ncbi:MAG: type IV pilin N-terminal domain-containing protein, partial [Halobacteriales archaeon]|nr:type IV pilin N-terminal domain-containing protein [Halobacteriales archaeon]